jgi:alpha-galactosidase
MDYVKMDWCNTVVNGTQLRPEIQYAQMSRALNATGRPMYFLSCEWGVDDPWTWMRQYANSWRSGGDHHDNWGSTASIIDHNANLGVYAGPGGWNYFDFLMTGGEGCSDFKPGHRCPGMTDTEYRTEFTIWVIAASPLIVATDLRNMSAIQKEILFNKEMLAVHQDKLGHAGGRIGTWNCNEANACEIWAKNLFDGSYAVALYNKGAQEHSITLNFTALTWPSDIGVSIRDLWAHKDLGTFKQSFSAPVPSHGVVALKASFA